MTCDEMNQLREDSIVLKTQLDDVAISDEDRATILVQLSKNLVVVRETVLREHFQSCPDGGHSMCDWNNSSDANNVLNDDVWTEEKRLSMCLAVETGIADGTIIPAVKIVIGAEEYAIE